MMSKYQKEKEIIQAAIMQAAQAAKNLVDENPNVWYPCGMAGVKIKPARGRFVSALKELELGWTSEEGGYVVSNPSMACTQWMPAQELGAEVFADVLKEHGVGCRVYTRID